MSPKAALSITKQRNPQCISTSAPAMSTNLSVKDKLLARITQPIHSSSKLSFTSQGSAGPVIGTRSDSRNFTEEKVSARLRLAVTTLTEIRSLDSNSEDDVWSVIQVSSEVDINPRAKAPTSLDVVVVLDCSMNVSPHCMTDAAEQVIHISRLLDHDSDRLAIIASSQRHSENKCLAGCLIRPLETPDPISIEADLQYAVSKRVLHKLGDVDLKENLAAAFTLLGYSQQGVFEHKKPSNGANNNSSWSTLSSKRVSVETARLVILVSPSPGDFYNVLGPAPPVPFHVIRPGSIPCCWSEPKHFGWLISTSCLQMRINSLDLELKQLIHCARQRHHLGTIKNIELDVEPALGCSIERLIGSQKHETLRPGESFALAVQVHIPKWKKLTEPSNVFSENRRILNHRLIQNLEGLLGIARQELFSVRVSYKDPQSNLDRAQFQHTKCTIGRHDTDSDWLGWSRTEFDEDRRISRSKIYKQLMFLVSQTYSLNHVRQVLDDIVPTRGLLEVLGVARNLLESEIQYNLGLTVRMTRDFPLQTRASTESVVESESKASPGGEELYTESRVSSTSVRTSSNEYDANQVPWSAWWSKNTTGKLRAGSADEGRSDRSGSSTATTIHHEIQGPEETENLDKARMIWKLMRRDSKSKRQPHQDRMGERNDATWPSAGIDRKRRQEAIWEQALQNKRSIGADTLRSLSMEGSSLGIGGHSPWL